MTNSPQHASSTPEDVLADKARQAGDAVNRTQDRASDFAADAADSLSDRVAGVIESLRGNDTVRNFQDSVVGIYRKYPTRSKLGLAAVLALLGSALTRRARR